MAQRYEMSEEQLSLFTGFEVSITIFEGPLDLLLHLVRRQQVDISEIKLAEITAQYITYVTALEALSVDLAAEFIVVAAQLLYIKSRSLLPMSREDEEDEEDVGLDPQAELARRLEEYRAYRDAAEVLEDARKLRRRVYLRSTVEDQVGSGFVDLADVSVFDMIAAVGELLKRAEPDPPRVVHKRPVTVAQRLPEIITALHRAGEPLQFCRLVDMPASRVYIIVTFLSILELIRRGLVRVGPVEGEADFRVWLVEGAFPGAAQSAGQLPAGVEPPGE